MRTRRSPAAPPHQARAINLGERRCVTTRRCLLHFIHCLYSHEALNRAVEVSTRLWSRSLASPVSPADPPSGRIHAVVAASRLEDTQHFIPDFCHQYRYVCMYTTSTTSIPARGLVVIALTYKESATHSHRISKDTLAKNRPLHRKRAISLWPLSVTSQDIVMPSLDH